MAVEFKGCIQVVSAEHNEMSKTIHQSLCICPEYSMGPCNFGV